MSKGESTKNKMLRRTIKAASFVLVFLLLLPVLIYIPPIQDFLKNVACNVASDATGMKISIDRFRLKFPLDIALDGVVVIESTGDTMVVAKEAIADLKLIPLFDLQIQPERLSLNHGMYRMMSADSSMLLKAQIESLSLRGENEVDLSHSIINLNKVELAGGNISLKMDVWKAKPQPEDTTATKWTIKIGEANLKDVSFAMSMLPSIDTLALHTGKIILNNALIDLNSNNISAERLISEDGSLRYLTPTPEYIATHPAPIDTLSPQKSKPMTIRADSICLKRYSAIYGMKGVAPQPGFDPTWIEADSLSVSLADFSMNGNDITAPLLSLQAKERCGLEITDAHGTIALSQRGITIDDFYINTSNSQLYADADVSYSLMEMKENAPVDATISAKIGFADILHLIPSLGILTKGIPTYNPLKADLKAIGTLNDVSIEMLQLDLYNYLHLIANGRIRNFLDIKKMQGHIEVDGELANTSLVNQIVYDLGAEIPPLSISGSADINQGEYIANMELFTAKGDIVLDGNINLNSEEYFADVSINQLQLQTILPALGIGKADGHILAEGSGFDPTDSRTWASIKADITEFEYNSHNYGELSMSATLEDSDFTTDIISYDPFADMDFHASGSLLKGHYTLNAHADINHLDLQSLGFSDTMNSGSGVIRIIGDAIPSESLYDVTLNIENFDWNLPGRFIHLPKGLTLAFKSEEKNVGMILDAANIDMAFKSPCQLDTLINRFITASDTIMQQVSNRQLSVDKFRPLLPEFELSAKAAGKGMIKQILSASGISTDSLSINIINRQKLSATASVNRLNTGSLQLDTITLRLNERGRMLDYRLHVGNRKGTLDEFAQINLIGYLGGNRASASLTQKNIKGETGYRLGLTAALMDSAVSVHFTPLNATIAYLPWTFNEDNHLDYYFSNSYINAKLEASSNDSHIKLNTIPDHLGGNALNVSLANIRIEDFLKLNALAPPVKGTVNSEMKLVYRDNAITGNGNFGINSLTYDRQRVGDFDFEFDAGLGFNGKTGARISLLVDRQKVLTGYGITNTSDSVANTPTRLGLKLNDFPLKIANAFLGKDVASLNGTLRGDLTMTGELTTPKLNGDIKFYQASVYLPIMGASLKMDSIPVTVTDNIVNFNSFKVWGANKNPITISGDVDARNITDIGVDLNLNGKDVQLINNDKRSKSDIYGKLFMTLGASAKGKLNRLDINANASVLSATDIYYTIPDAQSVITEQSSTNVVKFVQFSDTTKVVADTTASTMSMRINTSINIVNGAKATVNLSASGGDRVQLSPYGTLTYNQSYMGDMRLNGQLNLGTGYIRYTPPLMGEKLFTLQPDSYVLWNGDVMNPILNIHAVNNMKATVKQDGQNSRVVNFDISLAVTNTLSSPGITFDVSTEDDVTVQNELQAMSTDQRSNQAMNMLITNAYTGGAAKSASNISENALYSFLTSQLNSWAASNIRGVDLSFGIDQYDRTVDGQNSSSMSYSYQVSKSLFDNRFKIVVGGNYSTDASADENFAQNLISDISFEYMLKQTSTLSMYLKLFRHTGYESILEGEITETGAGFVMKRRLQSLKHLFLSHGKKKKQNNDKDSTSAIKIQKQQIVTTPDSILGDEIPESEGYDILN